MTDVLATVPRRDSDLSARLLIAMACEALTLGDRDEARRHLVDALEILPEDATV